ncbi:helix-turn-helix transcriptional regulator [Balneatrix alpica]|uniref:helix-turn-helix transcriptional regulator n=1 Tax=Balneatrix alpica TaxID=75684 RepID=UPI002738C616|nr:YafY family protein [Balneatrix alpica]
MSKAERLLLILTLLKGRRTALTAEQLAARLEVSVRTLYRDMQALSLAGFPIEGEAGVGYRLRPGSALPPIMFDAEEALALLLGCHMVKAWSDPTLAAGALRAIDKIRAVLPEEAKQRAERTPYLVPDICQTPAQAALHQQLREACEQYRVVQVDYRDAQGQHSQRSLWPLGLVFWGQCWTLVGWCELRQDYRNFRLDRIHQLVTLTRHYPKLAEPSLAHFIAQLPAPDQEPLAKGQGNAPQS